MVGKEKGDMVAVMVEGARMIATVTGKNQHGIYSCHFTNLETGESGRFSHLGWLEANTIACYYKKGLFSASRAHKDAEALYARLSA